VSAWARIGGDCPAPEFLQKSRFPGMGTASSSQGRSSGRNDRLARVGDDHVCGLLARREAPRLGVEGRDGSSLGRHSPARDAVGFSSEAMRAYRAKLLLCPQVECASPRKSQNGHPLGRRNQRKGKGVY